MCVCVSVWHVCVGVGVGVCGCVGVCVCVCVCVCRKYFYCVCGTPPLSPPPVPLHSLPSLPLVRTRPLSSPHPSQWVVLVTPTREVG